MKEIAILKKILLIIFIFSFTTLTLSACKKEPKILNETNTRAAKRVINAVDDYLDGKTSTEEARDIVTEESNNVVEVDDSIERTYSLLLKVDIDGIGTSLDLISWGNEDDNVKTIKDKRNSIAEYIGEKQID